MTLTIGTGFAKPWVRHSVEPAFAADAARRHAKTAERMAQVRGAMRPSAALRDTYRTRLLRLIDAMSKSVIAELERVYGRQEDKIALVAGDGLAYDATAANDLRDAIRALRRRWLKRFEEMSGKLANFFATEAAGRSDAQLKRILRQGGMSVKFTLNPPVREVLRAIVNENVALIKSIPEQYFTQVEGAVMRSVSAGRDLAPLVRELREQHGVTRRRAELIALDQNNKSSSAITKVRYLEVGIEEAVWCHSHAGRSPRVTHVANDGKRYKVAEGWHDPDPKVRVFIRPGELISCRCFSRPVLPGLRP